MLQVVVIFVNMSQQFDRFLSPKMRKYYGFLLKKFYSPSTIALKGGVSPCLDMVKIFIKERMADGELYGITFVCCCTFWMSDAKARKSDWHERSKHELLLDI